MTKRVRRGLAGRAPSLPLGLAAAFVGMMAAGVQGASAECLRQIYNRSGLVLVASQDGGPPAVLMPGQSLPVVLSQPGRFELAAYCAVPVVGGDEAPVVRGSFSYEAVLDRCFVKFGNDFFMPQIGRGFFATQSTVPFTLNTPRQGDVVLGPYACPVPRTVLDRRG